MARIAWSREKKLEQIVAMMRKNCRDGGCREVGIELEHFIIDRETKRRQFYEGARGVHRVLEALSAKKLGHDVYLEGHLIGIEAPEYAISIEPGAQFEISVAHDASILSLREKYRRALRVVFPVLDEYKETLLTLGVDPVNPIEEIPLIPKMRYEIMNRRLHEKGSLARAMMRQSCALQIALDYCDEADFVEKYRILSAMSPILYTLFDNSPRRGGEELVHFNMRQEIWRNTDPARTGIVPGTFDEGFGFAKYAEWILGNAPLFVPRTDGTIYESNDRPLAELLDEASSEEEAMLLIRHAMSIVFPDIRLKNYLEIRIMDEVPEEMAFGAAAMLKGLLYCKENQRALAAVFAPATEEMVERGKNSGRDNGIQGYYFSDYFAHWGLRLLDLANRGLPEEERALLAPLRTLWDGLDTPRLLFEQIEREAGFTAAIAAFEVKRPNAAEQ